MANTTRVGGRSISFETSGTSANTRRATERIQRSFERSATNGERKDASTTVKGKAVAMGMDTMTIKQASVLAVAEPNDLNPAPLRTALTTTQPWRHSVNRDGRAQFAD